MGLLHSKGFPTDVSVKVGRLISTRASIKDIVTVALC